MGLPIGAGIGALVGKRLLAEVDAVNVTVKEVGADVATALDDEAAAAGGAPAS